MSRRKGNSKIDFIKALCEHNEFLAKNNLGIFANVDFYSKKGSVSNIIINIIVAIIGVIVGVVAVGFSEPIKGDAVLTNDGIHFFTTSMEKIKENGKREKKLRILDYNFFPFEEMLVAVRFRRGFVRYLGIRGTYIDGLDGNKYDYHLNIPNKKELLPILKSALNSNNIRVKKTRENLGYIAILTVLLGALAVLLFPSWINAEREMDYADFRREINAPMISHRFQNRTTTYYARIATDIFTLAFREGENREFVGARIAGNERMFLLELAETNARLETGDVVRVTSIGAGVISTASPPEENIFNRIFRHVEIFLGDVRVRYVARISDNNVLRNVNYFYMRAMNIESIVIPVVADSDIYVSATGEYQIIFVEAVATVRGQINIVVIYFNYEALTSHNASGRWWLDFAVYQGYEELSPWLHGLGSNQNRDIIVYPSIDYETGEVYYNRRSRTNEIESGEIFLGRRGFVLNGVTDTIRIVKYSEHFNVIFNHEIYVWY